MKLCKIVNTVKGTVLAEQAEIADTLFARLKGLLGRNALGKGAGMVITRCNSIHTFFMRFAIDVVFLNSVGYVVFVRSNLGPGRLLIASLQAKTVIELPVGIIKAAGVEIGNRIEINQQV